MPSIAQRMSDLFSGSEVGHGFHGVPTQKPGSVKWEINKTAKTVDGPATLDLWEAHLAGKKPLGVIPIKIDGTCVWGSIDRDDYDISFPDAVAKIERLKLPFVPAVSKSGGLHLFIFLSEPVPVPVLKHYLTEVSAMMGWAGSEIFPKQSEILVERRDKGNWMVMPYYGDDYDGKLRMQYGLKKSGGEMTIEEFLTAAEAARVGPDALIVKRRRTNAASGINNKSASGASEPEPDEAFGDGPPCLQHLAAQGVKPGMQNNTLLMMGIYYKKKYPEAWREQLEVANRTLLDPPGSAEGVMAVIRSLDKKDYTYTCKVEPMVSHCNSGACRLRKHGVGQSGAFPQISNISKLDTDPPIWFVDVDDSRLEVSTEVLQNYVKFHAACMMKVNKSFGALKQATWLEALGVAMEDINILDAPPEASRSGAFVELLEEFLTNRQVGTNREDILRGRPWTDEEAGLHFFQLKDLDRFVQREGDKTMTRGQMITAIKKLGGDHKFLNIKKSGKNCWFIPAKVFDTIEGGDAPPIKGVPI